MNSSIFKNYWHQPLHWLVFMAISLLISGCTTLITPNLKTELSELKDGQYRIDPSHTTLIFKVSHLGLSTFVGRFNKVEATLDFTPDDISATRLNAIVQMDSVDTNNPKLDKMLRGVSWFNTEQYPVALFETISAQALINDTFKFTGSLTFLGATAPIVLNVRFNGGANNMLTGRYTLGFTATADFLRSNFGMNKYIPIVGDEIELEVYAEFLRE